MDVTVASASAPAAKEIISIFDDLPPAPAWAPIASRMKGRENAGTPAKQKPKAQAPKVVAGQRKARLSKPLSPPRKPHAALKDSKQAVQKDEDVGTGIGKAKTKGAPLRDKLGLEIDSPPRKPLPTHLVNLKASPAVSLATRATKQRGAGTKPSSGLTKPTSPIVNMDIFVLDDEGRVVSKERRSSRTGVAAPPKQSAKATNSKVAKANAKVPVYVDSESEVEMIENPTRGQLKSKKRTTRTIVSDESDSDCDAPIPAPNFTTTDPKPKSTKTKPLQQARTTVEVKATNPKPVKRASTVEVLVPPAPYPTKSIPSLTSLPPTTLPVQPPKPRVPVQSRAPAFQLPASPIFRNRQLTPIRGRRSQGLFEPPSPPTPSYSELDLSLDFDELSLEGADISNLSIAEASIPECLRLLLEECHQEDIGPHDFSSFIESFPFDEILRAARERAGGELSFKKIGEASYSEVFGIGNVVLKVIPLRDEAPVAASNKVKPALKLTQKSARTVEESEEDGPFTSDARDVRKEIIVTRAMGEVHRGFVKLLKTYVVKGKYPEALLRLWDEYYEEKGSESVRPDTFSLAQAYAIIVLPNGGPDLEAYTFSTPSKTGWRQACSVFWQVAKSLRHAEHLVSFEHRDLHWGQILVKKIKAKSKDANVNSGAKRLAMDHLHHGVQVTIIDLGLSRMDAGDGSQKDNVQWTPFDDEIFMGEGDYQFDMYRMMRDHTKGKWDGYHPLTNVMWLHYLSTKLLRSKGLKPPSASSKKSAGGAGDSSPARSGMESSPYTEKDCYEALVEVEQWLRQSLTDAFPAQAKATTAAGRGKGRPRATNVMGTDKMPLSSAGPRSAGEVVKYGSQKGWVRASKLT